MPVTGVTFGEVAPLVGGMTYRNWTDAISGWTAYLQAGGASRETVELRTYHLRRIARELPDTTNPLDVTGTQLVEWMASHSSTWKPNTRRAYRGTLRSFYRWMVDVGAMHASPAHHLPPVKVPRARPRPTPEPVFRLALRIADKRVRLAIMLAGFLGLRRSEIARTRREHVEPVLGGYALRVIGKGGHERILPLPDELARDILGRDEGWLFPSSATGSHLTPAYLGKLVKAELQEHTTHTLRHRFGTVTLEACGNVRVVQELLGHARMDTVQIYTEVSPSSMRAAVTAAAADAA